MYNHIDFTILNVCQNSFLAGRFEYTDPNNHEEYARYLNESVKIFFGSPFNSEEFRRCVEMKTLNEYEFQKKVLIPRVIKKFEKMKDEYPMSSRVTAARFCTENFDIQHPILSTKELLNCLKRNF